MRSTADSRLAYTQDALEILEKALDLYREGRTAFYRVAAVQLRLLLCDTTHRHNQLVDLALLPLVDAEFSLPGIFFQGLLPLKYWLEQEVPVGGHRLSVRQFIRKMCDQDGGAHVDPRPESMYLYNSDSAEWVVKIGEAVLQSCAHLRRPQEETTSTR